MELRNIEEAAHVKEEVGRGNLPASGSARYVCCGLLCAELLQGFLRTSVPPSQPEMVSNMWTNLGLVNEVADRVFSGCYGEIFSSFSAKYKIACNCFYGLTDLVYSWHNQMFNWDSLLRFSFENKFEEIRWRGAAAEPKSTLISGTKKSCMQVGATGVPISCLWWRGKMILGQSEGCFE